MSALTLCAFCTSEDECECSGEPGQQPQPSVFDVLATKPAARSVVLTPQEEMARWKAEQPARDAEKQKRDEERRIANEGLRERWRREAKGESELPWLRRRVGKS